MNVITPQLPGTARRPPAGQTAYVCGDGDFEDCVTHLLDLGYAVATTSKVHGRHLGSPTDELREGIEQILNSDFVVVLPRWEFSRKRSVEVQVARELGLPILDCNTLQPCWFP